MNETKASNYQATIVLLVIVALGVIAFLYFDYQNKVKEKQQNLQACITSAERAYHLNWESSCARRSLGENCALPKDIADAWTLQMENDMDRCVELYK